MNLQDAALLTAGVIGSAVAALHGVLTQRLMVRPLLRLAGPSLSPPIRKLTALLLQFSTFNWFVGGLALIACGCGLNPQARLATGLLVGSSYLFASLGNLWATRSRHPGWALYAAAIVLIVYGVARPGG